MNYNKTYFKMFGHFEINRKRRPPQKDGLLNIAVERETGQVLYVNS